MNNFLGKKKHEKPNLDGVAKVVEASTGREYTPGAYEKSRSEREQSRLCRRFIKGPIPVGWLASVMRLRKPSAVKVAIALFYQRGLCKSDEFKIEPARFSELNIDELTRRRGLAELERWGLIAVKRRPGQSPDVAMIGVEL